MESSIDTSYNSSFVSEGRVSNKNDVCAAGAWSRLAESEGQCPKAEKIFCVFFVLDAFRARCVLRGGSGFGGRSFCYYRTRCERFLSSFLLPLR